MKPRDDAQRRAELKRLRLVAERDQLEAERKLLRAELLGALAAADASWRQDERVLSMRFRLDRVQRDWCEVVDELRALNTRVHWNRPPPSRRDSAGLFNKHFL